MKTLRLNKVLLMVFVSILLLTTIAFGQEKVSRGDLINFFKDITIEEHTIVRGDVVSLFGDANIKGEVHGDVVVIFGKVKVDNRVRGDVVSIFGGVSNTSKGEIDGEVVSVLGHSMYNEGSIKGGSTNILGFAPYGISSIVIFVSMFVLLLLVQNAVAYVMSLIAVILFSEKADRMADQTFNDGGRKAIIGLLTYAGAFIGAIILLATIIGIPLLAILIPATLLLGFLGNTVAKLAIGRKIKIKYNKQWSIMLELLVGTLIYALLEIIIVGKLITFAFKIIGIGEIIESRFGEKGRKELI